MQYTEIYNMLLLIDPEKTVDLVSWQFIQQALDILNFKKSIKIGF